MCKYDNSYMKMALVWAENSHAVRHKVGALIVKDNKIISDGYNGTPTGFDNDCENVTCDNDGGICPRSWIIAGKACSIKLCNGCPCATLTTKKEVLHAEANAITKLAKGTESSEGATLYVTLSPCFDCAKLIIQSGISRVVYGEKYRDDSGIELLTKAGVKVDFIDIKTL